MLVMMINIYQHHTGHRISLHYGTTLVIAYKQWQVAVENRCHHVGNRSWQEPKLLLLPEDTLENGSHASHPQRDQPWRLFIKFCHWRLLFFLWFLFHLNIRLLLGAETKLPQLRCADSFLKFENNRYKCRQYLSIRIHFIPTKGAARFPRLDALFFDLFCLHL